MTPLKRTLLFAIFALQIADVVSTDIVLAIVPGAEMNPAAAWLQSTLGPQWWIPKIALALFGIWCLATKTKRTWPAMAIVTVLLYVVAVNTVNALTL